LENTAGALAPGGVIPFEIPTNLAEKIFKKWINKQFLVPNSLKKNAKIHPLAGIYLPYWAFFTKAICEFTVETGKIYRIGKISYVHWTKRNGTYRKTFPETIIKGSKRHKTAALKSVEPYDFSQAKSYKPHFLSGFAAERYSVGLKEGFEKCQTVIKNSLQESLPKAVKVQYNADLVRKLKFSIRLTDITYKNVLVPLWMSHFTYKNEKYEFLINGQTGKLGGKTPKSAGKILYIWLVILVFLGLVGFLIYANTALW